VGAGGENEGGPESLLFPLDTPFPRGTFSRVTHPGMKRFALILHYDGGPFHGWQLQREQPTVQGALEGVLERLTGMRRPVVGSGRTDRGVHAAGQVATVKLPPRWEATELRRALNALLPRSIWVEEVRQVPEAFHPRYHALRRSYVYQVGLQRKVRSPFLRGACWPLDGEPLDPGLLVQTAALIPGDRSFRNFAKAGQPKRGERCRVDAAGWSPWNSSAMGELNGPWIPETGSVDPDEAEEALQAAARVEALGIRFTITANRYLHHMVRYLVGTMIEVARGGRPPEEMAELLANPETSLVTSPPAPAEGLFLARVEYPSTSWDGGPELPQDRDPPRPPTRRRSTGTE
jgi:tRNA pseudouridine38-40 synthase